VDLCCTTVQQIIAPTSDDTTRADRADRDRDTAARAVAEILKILNGRRHGHRRIGHVGAPAGGALRFLKLTTSENRDARSEMSKWCVVTPRLSGVYIWSKEYWNTQALALSFSHVWSHTALTTGGATYAREWQ
jgi:hypothetical protein